MKIAIIADGRSPITKRWITMLQPLGYEIHLVTTFPCPPMDGVKSLNLIPVAFSRYAGSQAGRSSPYKKNVMVARFRKLAGIMRHWLGPWTVSASARDYIVLIAQLQPDLVHALRIPFEGMLASHTPPGIPLVVSTWGNDLTLHAPSTPRMGALTRKTLRRADALMSDTRCDVDRAHQWGLDPKKPTLTVVGNGGINLDEILEITKEVQRADPPQIINPRGIRSYVRNDTFFKAIPLVLEKYPQAKFVCTSMAGQKEATDWLKRLGIEGNVRLLPMLPQPELWREFARSLISVSVSVHDGTPNSLLEAMTLGCLPICGDLPSIREWITDGENGLLVDPSDPRSLADAILRGLEDHALQNLAAQQNSGIIRARADLDSVRKSVKDFYQIVL